MRNFLVLLVLIAFFGLLQGSFFFAELEIRGVKPDLLLILITFVAFKKGSMEGQLTGFGAGFMQQIFSGGLFGLYSFTLTIVGYVMGLVQRKVYAENFITAIVLVFFATLVKGAAFGIAAVFFNEVAASYPAYLKNGLLLELIYNPVMAGPVFWLLGRFASPAMR